ncbi:MAG: hypothetical protein ACRC35_12760 [Angustibacter sp.]
MPFSGQPSPPPLLIVFVEREPVGPLSISEPMTRAQLEDALPGATLGPSTRVPVTGATDAVQFDVRYTTRASTSILDTPLRATPVRQRELLVDVPGLPKYGLRYAAPSADFDEVIWAGLLRSFTVRVGFPDTPDSASPQSS